MLHCSACDCLKRTLSPTQFEAMIQSGQIVELRCFYDHEEKEFHSVVQLGRDVCGFPQTVHGGLTAAIMDETLGGLGVSLWRSGAIGWQHAHLESEISRPWQQAGAI